MHQLTQTEREVIDRFGWSLVDRSSASPRSGGGVYLTHALMYGDAKMAIPVDLEHGTLTQAVAAAAYTFNPGRWIRSADLSKYAPKDFISVQDQVRGDAEYAQRELNTLRSALGIH